MSQVDVQLTRFCYGPMGTFGRLSDGLGFTLERPWQDNRPYVSCIPPGRYRLIWHESPRFGRTLAVLGNGVTVGPGGDRTDILVHAANTADELAGCIAPGRRLGAIDGLWAVLESAPAVRELHRALEHLDDLSFEICNAQFPEPL